ncbi:YdcF family protein [Dyadobacter luticola]|uniref:YdcF family protein n=1 Tax=Dyadobacter luticola TaxID=1979387 RepID=A0A5R9KRJ6_9BACT|nr:YdcF family protein [Dyadobacter luticola]TLU98840.1 YdcF family protein [Dyadobacter luticola]
MFYFLSKAIDFLVMPLSIILLLLAYTLMVKDNHKRKQLVTLVLVLLLLISNSYLVLKAFNWWEPRLVNINSLENTYDVGILLSGGLIASNKPDAEQTFLGTHGDRVLQTFQLYKAGKIRKILITGASQEYLKKGRGETKVAAELLVKWGVKASDIVFEEKARNTRENALFSAKIIKKYFPGGRYLLITSAFHIRRSAGCFDKVGIKTDTFPSDFYGGYNALTFKNAFHPNPGALADFSALWHEVIGFIVYKMMGFC